MKEITPKELIINTLSEKANTKQIVYDNSLEAFNNIKECLQEITKKINSQLKDKDKRILLEYRDRGMFEAEIKIAGDLIIFNMHSNIFEFDRSHGIWKTSYIRKNKFSADYI